MIKKLILIITIVLSIITFRPSSVSTQTTSDNWLQVLNLFRAQSNLPLVTDNPTWSDGTFNHSCWMLLNGVAHDEQPGTPGYSVSGDIAGNNSNVAATGSPNSNAASFINLWMSGPFHAIGMLREGLRETSYGRCSSPPNPTNTNYASAASLDVLRGLTPSKAIAPIVFPGPGATVNITKFISEYPDPRNQCGWQGRTVGLPIVALMPSPVTTATGSLIGPDGAAIETCLLHANNTSSEMNYILRADDAIVMIPASPLMNGNYQASVQSDGGSKNWNFTVNNQLTTSQLLETVFFPAPTTANFQSVTAFRYVDSRDSFRLNRLQAGRWTRISLGEAGLPQNATAVSANFTVTEPEGSGFLTMSNCNQVGVPTFSTLNYVAGETVPNQSIIPIANNSICAYSTQNTHLLIDINGYVSPSGGEKFTPIDPFRLLDTRQNISLAAGGAREIPVVNLSNIPSEATGVSINIVALESTEDGWIRITPCVGGETVSNVNFVRGGIRSNSTMVKLSDRGSLCIYSSTQANLVIDVNGWFGPGGQLQFNTVSQQRLLDTRSGYKIPGGTLTQIPLNNIFPSSAMNLNVTSVGAAYNGWLNIGLCNNFPGTSILNYPPTFAAANNFNFKNPSNLPVCVYSLIDTDLIVDINGYWS